MCFIDTPNAPYDRRILWKSNFNHVRLPNVDINTSKWPSVPHSVFVQLVQCNYNFLSPYYHEHVLQTCVSHTAYFCIVYAGTEKKHLYTIHGIIQYHLSEQYSACKPYSAWEHQASGEKYVTFNMHMPDCGQPHV